MRKSKPSEEIQSLLDMFVQDHEIFKGLPINLRRSRLNGADLRGAHLEKALLTKTHLRGADLSGAHLQGADLRDAHLQGADLRGAQLHGANFTEAQLHGANLTAAWLHGANFREAQLHGANLTAARLHGAFLGGAQLHRALLGKAQLHGAFLGGAQLHGAFLRRAQLHGASSHPKDSYELKLFEASIKEQIGKESDLSGAIFAGGLIQEAVDSIGTGLSDEAANKLREKLVAHIGEPESNELPENSGTVTGAYTAEEAEQWIAEYNEVMSEVGRVPP